MAYDIEQLPNQDGRIAIVTGSNTGLGYHNALDLASKGAKVVMACRTESRARDAMEKMGSAVFLDERDGQLYPFARFGDAEWTLRNLHFAGVDGAIAWGDDSENRYQTEDKNVQHGLLYPFEVARLAVPTGWRLPTDQDWQALIKPMGGFNQDGQPPRPYSPGRLPDVEVGETGSVRRDGQRLVRSH